MGNLDFDKLKESFLDQGIYTPGTVKYMRFVLFGKKTKELEDKYKKDLCLFNLHELKILLGSFKAISKESLRSKRTVIGKYIDYAIDKGYVESRMNFADDIKEEDLDTLIYKYKAENKYITEEELDNICKEVCINFQDEIIFRLPFEGIKGEASSELMNLKVNDIDMKNNIVRIGEGNTREIEVSTKTIQAINEAIKEEEYESYIVGVGSKCKARKLYKTEYVFRKSSKIGGDKPNYQTVVNRLKKIRAEAGYPALTIETIWWSGIFNYAKNIKEKNGVLTDKDYDEIIKRYGGSTKDAYKYVVINAINENI